MAGYSGTPLPQKLGIKPGARVALVGAPEGLARTLGELPEGVAVRPLAGGATRFDVILCFARSSEELRRRLGPLPSRLQTGGGLWIAWPKKSAQKSAALTTDLTEAEVRARGLGTGLVDNKVCAIDDTWSGLRFVVRVSDRRALSKK